ncbi:MAG: ribosome maturation factor RimM [Eubacteriales bacterium]|nr:ribosome maturation factor RimM [Eubacteriales bacterium]
MNKELRVGVIVRTHGIRGEVKVYPTTDSPDRFGDIETCILRHDNRVKQLKVESARYFKNLVILKFEGIDNINDITPYIGYDIYVKREDGVPLEEGEYYIADIIGMDVYDENRNKLGVIRDVLETGANDVYIVERTGKKDLLIPATEECLLDVDVEKSEMTVHLLEGLLELYD